MENKQEKPTVSSPTCTALLCCIDDYDRFEFKEGQILKVGNATFEIKNINGILYVSDYEGYSSQIKQKGKSDTLKSAIECGYNIELIAI